MVGIGKALVIGGGIGGMCAAIELRKRGVAVDLVEIDSQWRVYEEHERVMRETTAALLEPI